MVGTMAPATNWNGGDADLIVQAGRIDGGVHQTYSYQFTGELIEASQIDEDDLRELRRRFVAPDGFDAFIAEVTKSRFGVVIGEPGNGRWTTAMRTADLLDVPPRPITLEDDEDWSLPKLPCESGQGYVLDLSENSPLSEGRFRVLLGYATKAKQRGSAVVIVLRPEQWLETAADAVSVLRISAPPAVEVFERHLMALAPIDPQVWRSDSRILGALRGAQPGDAARLARLAGKARGAASHGDTDQDWINTAIQAFGNWKDQLRPWFAERLAAERTYERVLLASVAILENEAADHVLAAADLLAEELAVPPSDPTGISGPGLDSAMAAVAAEVTPGRRVRFQRVAYASAVLDYLWEQHPRVRPALLNWSGKVATGRFPALWRSKIAERWLELAERHNDWQWVGQLFESWAQTSQTRSLAVSIGRRVAEQPRAGRNLRRRLYEQAKRPVSTRTAVVVAEVCAGYGMSFPNSALTRLKWLADHGDAEVQGAVHDALRTLWAEAAVRPLVLAELFEWVSDAQRRERVGVALQALVRLVSESTDSGALLVVGDGASQAEVDVPAVTKAWELVLTHADRETVDQTVDVWMAALVRETVPPEVVVGVFTEAVRGSFPRVHMVARSIVSWEVATGTADPRVAAVLRHVLEQDPLRSGSFTTSVHAQAGSQ
ncbi:hypothetical protein [Marinactinospora rubrisoli]|uniref:Uncharacterized protein n=1 Tax=Marinactinospora rubrisoli TaxID=2715399 RepID=A0ABW2KL43_9ACTN